MSTFKFNFFGDSCSETTRDNKIKDIVWFKSEEVPIGNPKKLLKNSPAHARMFTCGDIEIGHVGKEAVLKMGDMGLKQAINLAEKEHSDLITAKYEGGLKIWECTYDMIEHLADDLDIKFNNLKVLDLGCGAGILGIYAFMNGAHVVFQDYNKEVLECVTIPNVLLNIDDENNDVSILDNCKFYSGDWASFNEILSTNYMFDIILTSETIYNPDNYEKIINLILQRLKKDGTVYIAAKTCYFGVGGGMREFEKCVQKHPFLKTEVSWKSSDGIQREILKITRSQDIFMIE